MKRKFDQAHSQANSTIDASDRAASYKVPGERRIPLHQIGFWPGNRGGLGLSPPHVHEVAHDCMANGTRLERYLSVHIVKIPPHLLDSVRQANRDKCASSDLLPTYSDDIEYVCATHTHFTHAHKLCQEGTRYLHNKNTDSAMKIRWKQSDSEGADILMSGPVCVIYRQELFEDADAMQALCSQDNLNACVQMEQDEIQAFGRVHMMIDNTINKQDSQCEDAIIERDVLQQLKITGLGQYSEDDWLGLIRLRMKIGHAAAKIFTTCQFHECAGRVRVRSADFAMAAKIDHKCKFAMIGIVLSQSRARGEIS